MARRATTGLRRGRPALGSPPPALFSIFRRFFMADIRFLRRAAPALGVLAALLLTVHNPLSAQAPKARPQPSKAAAAVPGAASVVPAADATFRLKAWDTFVSMRAASPFKDLKWQFLGPTSISGRVVDVAVANRKAKTRVIYVATASGGLWKTENEGTTFEPVFEQAASVQGGNVEVAPSDPNVIWFG